MNLIIIIFAGVAAYFGARFADSIDTAIDELILWFKFKKNLKSDLFKHKLRVITRECERICLAQGYCESQAKDYASDYAEEIFRNGLVDEKYKLIKGA